MTEQSSIPVEAQAVPDQPVAWMVSGDGEAMRPFCTRESAELWIADERQRGSPYRFTAEPLFTRPTPAPRVEVTLPDGDDRDLRVDWQETKPDGTIWVCIDVGRPTPAAADLHQQSHSYHLAGDAAGQDFRGGSALPAAAPSAEWQWEEATDEMLAAFDKPYPRHKFWGAGEPDCPQDLKAPNGELHTMRCKVCGDGWRKSVDVCFAAITRPTGLTDEQIGVLREWSAAPDWPTSYSKPYMQGYLREVVAAVAASPAAAARRPTDDELNEWAERHDLGSLSLTDLRCIFEDAQTLVPVAASPAAAAEMSTSAGSGLPTETQHHAALQRIGHALGLPAGTDLHQQCVPAIEALKRASLIQGTTSLNQGVDASSPVAPVGAPTRQHSVHLAADDAEQDFHDGPALSTAARDVLTERERQKSVEGWTPEHDDEHDGGQMANAAAAYAMEAANQVDGMMPAAPNDIAPSWWPWDEAWWKPKDARRNLVRAGALILAEIERMDRALLSRPGCELATDATTQLREHGPTADEAMFALTDLYLALPPKHAHQVSVVRRFIEVHLAATPIDQDFRMRPASSEAAPSGGETT